jgi:signal recognition particle receptor subunit alpha
MFDIVCVFSTGGVILWLKAFSNISIEIINTLVKDVLIQEKTSLQLYRHGTCIIKWRLAPELGLVFAIIYQEILNLLNVDDFLDMLVKDFTARVAKNMVMNNGLYENVISYEEYFKPLMQQWERKFKEETNIMQKEFKDTAKGKKILDLKAQSMIGSTEKTKREILEKMFNKNKNKSQINSNKSPENNDKDKKSPKKELTEWDHKDKVSSKDIMKIDHSVENKGKSIEELKDIYLNGPEKVEGFISDDEEDDKAQEGGFFSSLSNKIKTITGNKILTNEDIDPVFKSIIELLQSKNVAHDVIMSITSSLRNSLLSQKTASFTSVKTTVKNEVRASLSRIITPKTYYYNQQH